jgi:hypothetical protein
MVVLGVLSSLSVILTRWGPAAGRVRDVSPAMSGVVE